MRARSFSLYSHYIYALMWQINVHGTFSDCLVGVIQVISVMMLLLRERLIITFKETDITLNRVSLEQHFEGHVTM